MGTKFYAVVRGTDETAGALPSYIDLESRVPAPHPPLGIRRIMNDALEILVAELASLCGKEVRPSVAPERLIRASLLRIPLFSRSKRHSREQVDYDLMFRWFVRLGMDGGAEQKTQWIVFPPSVWVPTVTTRNRDRLLTTDMSRMVMAGTLAHPEVRLFLSEEHFPMEGMLIKAGAITKSFQPKPDTAPLARMIPKPDLPPRLHRHHRAVRNSRGEKRSNTTLVPATDPDARLYEKSPGASAIL